MNRIYSDIGICIPYLLLDTYISLLEHQKYIGLSIGDQANRVLIEFSNKRHISTYKVYSNLKLAGSSKLDYKNTFKRVKRLEVLGFIEPVKAVTTEESKHRAKYYRITEAGMFQLFLLRDWWIPSSLQSQLPTILESHGDLLIFKTLLYPNFKKKTLTILPSLKSFKGDHITYLEILTGSIYEVIKGIYQYLRNCCTEIFEYVKILLKYHDESNHTLQDRVGLDIRLEYVSDFVALERHQLVMKILLLFQTYEGAEQMDVFGILAEDDKFMNVADDLHKDFEKSFNIAMRTGRRI